MVCQSHDGDLIVTNPSSSLDGSNFTLQFSMIKGHKNAGSDITSSLEEILEYQYKEIATIIPTENNDDSSESEAYMQSFNNIYSLKASQEPKVGAISEAKSDGDIQILIADVSFVSLTATQINFDALNLGQNLIAMSDGDSVLY